MVLIASFFRPEAWIAHQTLVSAKGASSVERFTGIQIRCQGVGEGEKVSVGVV